MAREFGARGCRVGLLARGRERLEAAKKDIENAGGKAIVLPADVANAEEVEAAADKVEQELGPIDVWVNDAMTTIFAPFHQITAAEFKRATEVTYLGTVYGTMSAMKRMRTRNRGAIVQVGSALAYRSIPLQSPYCGAKHAIAGFTDSIRSELIHQKSDIHITMVQLPAMNTPQFSWCRTRLPRHPQPVPPIFQPEVAARAIVWASSHRRREIYVGWPTVKAIYGQELAPGYADKYLAKFAYGGQETDQPVSPDRPDNLFRTRRRTIRGARNFRRQGEHVQPHDVDRSAQRCGGARRGGSCGRGIRPDAGTHGDEERSSACRRGCTGRPFPALAVADCRGFRCAERYRSRVRTLPGKLQPQGHVYAGDPERRHDSGGSRGLRQQERRQQACCGTPPW